MKIKTPHLFLIIVFVMTLALAANAATVKLSDYATPNDGQDDSVGFQTAINALQLAGGGTIIVDAGTWDICEQINLVTFQNYVSYKLIGDKGSVIRPHLGQSKILFYSGNTNGLELKDLVIVGDSSVVYDARSVVMSSYTTQLRISNCQFLGLRVSESLVYVGAATDAVIESNIFGGNAADIASIHGVNYRGLKIKDMEMFDYGSYGSQYYSKTPYNRGSWIMAEADGNESPNATNRAVVRIEDIRCDEGSRHAIVIKNASYFMATGLLINLSGNTGATGVLLDNVDHAEVKMSKFGYTAMQRPAITVINGTKLLVTGISLGGGVYYGDEDASSSMMFDDRFCTDCSARRLAPPAKK